MIPFWILILIFVFQDVNATVICDENQEKDVYLQIDEVIFFESLNFPKLPSDFCYINFWLNATTDANLTNVNFIYVFTNPQAGNWYNFYEDSSAFSFSSGPDDLEAFQAFAYFDSYQNNSCALESVTNQLTPFQFTDNNQILQIATSYFYPPDPNQNCMWSFEGPEGYGFKIVFSFLNFTSSVVLTVINSTDHVITNQNLVQVYNPYYNSDNHLRVLFSKGSILYPNVLLAYITIIENNPIRLAETCLTVGNLTKLWGTSDSLNYNSIRNGSGYSNSGTCSFGIDVSPGTEVMVLKIDFFMEYGVDVIKYTDEFGEHFLSDSVVLRAYQNDTPKHFDFNFTSDGSIFKPGFAFEFLTLICKCSMKEFFVDCENSLDYAIMNVTDDLFYSGANYYCSNLVCNFTIVSNPKCPEKLIEVMFEYTYGKNMIMFDVFNLIANDEVVFTLEEDSSYIVYLTQSNQNIFQVLTYDSPTWRILQLSLTTVTKPKVSAKITLTKANPVNIFDASKFDADLVVVELDKELIDNNATIKFYTNFEIILAYPFQFYNNESLTFELQFKNCFTIEFSYECSTKFTKFVIVNSRTNLDGYYMAFQPSNYNVEGCIFTQTVYTYWAGSHSPSLIGISNGIKPCMIHLLTDNIEEKTYIANAWTSSVNEMVEVYAGHGFDKEKIFDFNSTTSTQWKGIRLFSKTITVVIPINSSIKIDLEVEDDVYYGPPYNLTSSEKSVVFPYMFGGDDTGKYIANYRAETDIIKVTIKYCNISADIDYYIMANNKRYNITHIGQIFKFNNEVIEFYYDFLSSDISDYLTSTYFAFIEVIEAEKYLSTPSLPHPSTKFQSTTDLGTLNKGNHLKSLTWLTICVYILLFINMNKFW